MRVTLSTVLHIAELCKLKFSEEEAQKFTAELDKIIDYINKLQGLNISSKQIKSTTIISLRLREDNIVEGLSTSNALSGAPLATSNPTSPAGGYFVVPKLI